jgi:hypothetical protein
VGGVLLLFLLTALFISPPIIITTLVFIDARRRNTRIHPISPSILVFFLALIFPVICLPPVVDNYLLKSIASSLGAGLIYLIFTRIIKKIKRAPKIDNQIEKNIPTKHKSIIGLVLVIIIPIALIVIWIAAVFRDFN